MFIEFPLNFSNGILPDELGEPLFKTLLAAHLWRTLTVIVCLFFVNEVGLAFEVSEGGQILLK